MNTNRNIIGQNGYAGQFVAQNSNTQMYNNVYNHYSQNNGASLLSSFNHGQHLPSTSVNHLSQSVNGDVNRIKELKITELPFYNVESVIVNFFFNNFF